MEAIDLELQGRGLDQHLTAYLIAPGGNRSFSVPFPSELEVRYRTWRRRWMAHLDPAGPTVGDDAVRSYREQLERCLERWWGEPVWLPLQQALARHPGLPLRIRCEEPTALLERLPWEALNLDRPLWRLAPSTAVTTALASRPPRRPRLLLLVGQEQNLDLEPEIEALHGLQRRGRIEVVCLRGADCRLERIRSALSHPAGWEALAFLGHSEADAAAGGRLHLGDGSWLVGAALEADLQQATRRGLQLALLSSCNGIDLARTLIDCGVGWVLCFREAVPSAAASLAFRSILPALEVGQPLTEAYRLAREALLQKGPIGSDGLLSLYGGPASAPLQLPLRRRRRFLLRLASSTRAQLVIAATAVAIAGVCDLMPYQPLPLGLLDRRLELQRLWRQRTGQSPPSPSALPLLLLDSRQSPGAAGSATQQLVSRLALADVLRRTPPAGVPRVGLDVVMDQPGPEPEGIATLAAVLREQRRPEVFAGHFGATASAPLAGEKSRPIEALRTAGLQSYDLSVGTAPGAGPLRLPPLRLLEPIDSRHFAHALAAAPAQSIPAEAVIDWSLDWHRRIRRVDIDELPRLRAPVLVVGSDGYRGEEPVDLFQAPLALRSTLAGWGGSAEEMPGALVQAVLAMSLLEGSWLRPASAAATTALSCGLGVLLAGAVVSPSRRVSWLILIAAVSIPFSFQLAVSQRLLVPLLLPLSGLGATSLVRRT